MILVLMVEIGGVAGGSVPLGDPAPLAGQVLYVGAFNPQYIPTRVTRTVGRGDRDCRNNWIFYSTSL